MALGLRECASCWWAFDQAETTTRGVPSVATDRTGRMASVGDDGGGDAAADAAAAEFDTPDPLTRDALAALVTALKARLGPAEWTKLTLKTLLGELSSASGRDLALLKKQKAGDTCCFQKHACPAGDPSVTFSACAPRRALMRPTPPFFPRPPSYPSTVGSP